jgi:hypothetical protein
VFLHSAQIRIPPGHNGFTGFKLRGFEAAGGTTILPYAPSNAYIIANDEVLTFEIEVETDQFLQSVAYNTDIFAHTIYWRFTYTPVTLTTVASERADIVSVS